MDTDFAKQAAEDAVYYLFDLWDAFFYLTNQQFRATKEKHEIRSKLSNSKHSQDPLYNYFISKLDTNDSLVLPAEITKELTELNRREHFTPEQSGYIRYFIRNIPTSRETEYTLTSELEDKYLDIGTKVVELDNKIASQNEQIEELKTELQSKNDLVKALSAQFVVDNQVTKSRKLRGLQSALDEKTARVQELEEAGKLIQKNYTTSLKQKKYYFEVIEEAIIKLDRLLARYSAKGVEGTVNATSTASPEGTGTLRTPHAHLGKSTPHGQKQPQTEASISPGNEAAAARILGRAKKPEQLNPTSLRIKW